MKGNKGITLIALVITIIVLLILAAVSIAMLTGENSILKNASKAGDDTKLANAKEAAVVKMQEVITEFYQKKYAPEGNTTLADSENTLGTYIQNHFTSGEGYTYDKNATDNKHIKITGTDVTGKVDTTAGSEGKITWSDATT